MSGWRRLGGDLEHHGPQRVLQPEALEPEDQGTDLADRHVEVVDDRHHPGGDLGLQPAGQPLERESRGEQALDDVVVQVPTDPVAILQDAEPLLVGTGLGELEGQRGLLSEGRGHLEIGIVERRPGGDPAQHDGAA